MASMPIIALVGPTATGKTALSVALAKQLGAVIVSADSRCVYQGLDIGTAKPTLVEREGVVHYGMDVALPTECFTVAQYQALATQTLQALQQANTPVIVVGGTGFYLQAALQCPHQVPAVPPNPAIRARLQAECELQGLPALYARLHQLDPRRASQLYPQDAFRILRALEIIEITGKPVPEAPTQPEQMQHQSPYSVHWLGLCWNNRERHRQVIANRVVQQVKDGWIEEVEHLVATHGSGAHALQVTHGYPEWVTYLQQVAVQTTAAKEFRQAVMTDITQQVQQYARRQHTWFQRNTAIQWFSVEDTHEQQRLQWALQACGL
ncbi:MAG: tRNA (adenosine(37)-N6)-dimethylallyltransferase MiaA [Vampirovibrionales bacterium]